MGSSWWWFVQPLQLSLIIDYVGGTAAVYIGETAIGNGSLTSSAVWRIKKLTYDVNGNVLTSFFAPNANNFGDIWANRVSLSYA